MKEYFHKEVIKRFYEHYKINRNIGIVATAIGGFFIVNAVKAWSAARMMEGINEGAIELNDVDYVDAEIMND